MNVTAEISMDTGEVRLLDDGKPITRWTRYDLVASAQVDGRTYFAASAFWEGTFPVGKVFVVTEVTK